MQSHTLTLRVTFGRSPLLMRWVGLVEIGLTPFSLSSVCYCPLD